VLSSGRLPRDSVDGIVLLLLPHLSPIHVVETGGRRAGTPGQAGRRAGTGKRADGGPAQVDRRGGRRAGTGRRADGGPRTGQRRGRQLAM